MDATASSSQPNVTEQRRIAVLAVHHLRAGGFLQLGGAEKYAREVVAALLDAGAAVQVGYSGDSIYDDLANRADSNRLTVERTAWLNEHLSGDGRIKPGVVRQRRRWLRDRQIDTLVAIQQNGGGAFACALVAGRMLGLRVVSSIRQQPIAPPCGTGKRWLGVIPSPELWRRRLVWRRRVAQACCDVLIFNSRAVADAHHALFCHDRRRERIIPNGDTVASHVDGCGRADSLALLRSSEPTRLASVGRVTEAKGADVLLEAFGRLAPVHPKATLTYYGDGPLIPTLRDRAARLGVAERVRFAGYCDDREAMFADIDVYVQPSRRESMSNSVVEAMARGIPCVVADAGGLPETVDYGRSGVIFPSGRPERCAEAIDRVLSDPGEWRRLAESARRRAAEAFDRDRVRRLTVEAILG